MANPLADNCQGFRTDSSGKVVGVQLGITKVEGALYEVYSVRLRDEYEAVGQTIAACSVLDASGINTGLQVRMAWPGRGPAFQDSGLPGNPNNVHMIANGYNPGTTDNPNLGPLALHVGGFNASISDIVYGLGLPLNRHVSYDVVFRVKGVVAPPPPPDDDTAARVAKLEAWARATSAYWKGSPQYG